MGRTSILIAAQQRVNRGSSAAEKPEDISTAVSTRSLRPNEQCPSHVSFHRLAYLRSLRSMVLTRRLGILLRDTGPIPCKADAFGIDSPAIFATRRARVEHPFLSDVIDLVLEIRLVVAVRLANMVQIDRSERMSRLRLPTSRPIARMTLSVKGAERAKVGAAPDSRP